LEGRFTVTHQQFDDGAGLEIAKRGSVSAEPFSSPLRLDFHYLRAALRAPSAGNRVNEIAAQATDVQSTGECVWLALLTLLCCLIFEDHNDVHG
jgi:hypothetical protein